MSIDVLLIEHDPVRAGELCQAFERAGYSVQIVADGIQGFWQSHRQPPRLVLLGADLPGLNEFRVLGHFKHHHQTKTIPIIMLIDEGRPDAVDLAWQLGADACLTSQRMIDQLPSIVQPFLPAALHALG